MAKRVPRWWKETCGSCVNFRRAVGEEIKGYAGVCCESSIRPEGFPRTTDSTLACAKWRK